MILEDNCLYCGVDLGGEAAEGNIDIFFGGQRITYKDRNGRPLHICSKMDAKVPK